MKPHIRRKVFIRDFYTCQKCGKSPGIAGLQVAHRIKNGSGTIAWLKGILPKASEKWLQDNVINNPLNLATACCLECNDSFNIFFDEIESKKLLKKILLSIDVFEF